MTNPILDPNTDQWLRHAQSPVMRLITGLATDGAGEIADPEALSAVMLWTRSAKPDTPEFKDQQAAQADYRHLGFFDDAGALIADRLATGRAFMRDHWQEPPNYPRFWRYMQAANGVVQPESSTPDYAGYSGRIANLIDKGANDIAVAEAVLAADRDGLDTPTFQLWRADRVRLTLETLPERFHDEVRRNLERRNIDWFPPDNVASALRRLLKDQHYGLSEDELDAWVTEEGQPSTLRQMRSLLGDGGKARHLRDLGLLDADWRWSEVGFQRHQAYLREAQALDQDLSFELIRWELHQRHHTDEPVPFEWALLDASLNTTAVHRARRAASIALSGGLLGEAVEVGDTSTQTELTTLRKIGAWIHGAHQIERWPALKWLALFGEQDRLNWENWRQICSFVADKLNQPPEPELIRDWLDGVVTFEGQGRHRTPPTRPFSGAQKVGRNDPCPCGSGKKHKKCCGR